MYDLPINSDKANTAGGGAAKISTFKSKYKRPRPENFLLVGIAENLVIRIMSVELKSQLNSRQGKNNNSSDQMGIVCPNATHFLRLETNNLQRLQRANIIAQILPTPKKSYSNDASSLKLIRATHGVTGNAALTVISIDLAKNLGLEIEWENKRIVKTASEDNITVYRCPQVNLEFETFTSKCDIYAIEPPQQDLFLL
ncbi:hypothetical protein BB561_002893 [Smittium simulii]|uniref:Uncharacterized protein n=1 Tax=Smittium simulii TaxID=133385 RepID=A0A2T9YNU9_9FUNG|nr:hypothetical protein BB561_002893 [Smittium simulii]